MNIPLNTLDTCGLSCPQPVLLVKKALESQQEGIVSVVTDADVSRENISRFAITRGWAVTVAANEAGRWLLQLTKGQEAEA